MEPDAKQPVETSQEAEAHVAEAQTLLKRMRGQLAHPDLDLAIEKLEMALSILTSNTGGML